MSAERTVGTVGPGGWAPYLDPGERLLWEGAPDAGVRVRGSDIAQSVFGLFFLGFALFWTFMASTMGAEAGGGFRAFGLFGLPFIAVGAYLVCGHFFWKAYERSKTRYALTTERAIVAKSALGRSMRSFPIRSESEVAYEPGDPATIWFHREVRRGRKRRRTIRHGFEYIADGDNVYRLMRSVQAGDFGDRRAE